MLSRSIIPPSPDLAVGQPSVAARVARPSRVPEDDHVDEPQRSHAADRARKGQPRQGTLRTSRCHPEAISER